jgi:hypothetical protein
MYDEIQIVACFILLTEMRDRNGKVGFKKFKIVIVMIPKVFNAMLR